jgi:hypothetical protein
VKSIFIWSNGQSKGHWNRKRRIDLDEFCTGFTCSECSDHEYEHVYPHQGNNVTIREISSSASFQNKNRDGNEKRMHATS